MNNFFIFIFILFTLICDAKGDKKNNSNASEPKATVVNSAPTSNPISDSGNNNNNNNLDSVDSNDGDEENVDGTDDKETTQAAGSPPKKKKKKKGGIGGAFKKIGGALGGKKNPLSKLISAITKMPKILTNFGKASVKITKTLMKARKIMISPQPDPQAINAINIELTAEIAAFEKIINDFRANNVYKNLEQINNQCGTTVMTAGMSIPYVGTAVAGMCGKVATTDLKVNSMLFQAETTLVNAMTAKEGMNDKMAAMQQSGGFSGMAQAAPNSMVGMGMNPQNMMGPQNMVGQNMVGQQNMIKPPEQSPEQ